VSSVFDPPGSPYARHLSLTDLFNFVAGSTLIKILRTLSCLVSSLVSKLYYIYIGVSDQSQNLNGRKRATGTRSFAVV
jgi:hypothetical protein